MFWYEQRGAWGYEFALDCGLLSDELDSDIEWIGTIHDKEDKHVK